MNEIIDKLEAYPTSTDGIVEGQPANEIINKLEAYPTCTHGIVVDK